MASPTVPAAFPRSRLPDGWSEPEVVEDVVVADGLAIRRAGIASVAPGGEEVTGAAADVAAPPVDRARFELWERAAVVEALRDLGVARPVLRDDGRTLGTSRLADFVRESDAPSRWSYSRSNGVALHGDWTTAAFRARCELGERDRLLRSWTGHVRPEALALRTSELSVLRTPSFSWRAARFPETDADRFAADIEVVAVIGFPRTPNVPLVFGFAGRPLLGDALVAAAAEATQLLAFLWGEPVVQQCPTVKADPLFHLDYFQLAAHHQLLHRWLDGDHMRYACGPAPEPAPASLLRYVDLTPTWLGGGLRVAKATCCGAVDLTFGASPTLVHLPAPLHVHPVA